MISAGRIAAPTLLVLLLAAGCAEKKAKVTPPPQAQAPTVDTGKPGAMYPPPLTQPVEAKDVPPPLPAPTSQPNVQPAPPPAPAKPKHTPASHKPKPSAAKPATAASAPNATDSTTGTQSPTSAANGTAATQPSTTAESPIQEANNAEAADPSPIGELSTGVAAGQVQTRKETVDLIASTENGLNGIKRTLTRQEQETVDQIKTFLAKAKLALTTNDLDGAHTLATKAKVLLDELTKV